MDRRQRPSRPGFTLIETLVAILIIATLMAILLPAIMGAMRRAREAQVTAEINDLATGLASFNNKYNAYPPSRVILCETGFNSISGLSGVVPGGGDDMTYQQLIQRSRLYLRKFWPRVDFDTDPTAGGTVTPAAGNFNDFNGDNVCGAPAGVTSPSPYFVILGGSECLTFFLGGIPINNGDNTYGMSGFGQSPTRPFVSNSVTQNRTVPHYEFVVGRTIDQDGDFFPSYIDPLDVTVQRAYAYFSAYGANSYDPNDDNGNGHVSGVVTPEFEDDGSTVVERGFTLSFPTTSVTGASFPVSPAPNPYTGGAPATTGSVSWINPNSFQLFSAGQDRFWGLGGTFSQTSQGDTGRLPIAPSDPGIFNNADFTNGIRIQRESDNLTNFSGGRLN